MKYHAVLIDPDRQTVDDIETDATNSDIYALLTRPFQPLVDGLGSVRIDLRNKCWLDDFGFKKADTPVFQVSFYPTPLAGRGLILGHDAQGETCSTNIRAEHIRPLIQWPAKLSTGKLTPTIETDLGIRIGDPILKDKPK